jgi:hypothetical protein
MVGVDYGETLVQQLTAEPGSLACRVDTQPGQVPVWVPRMGGVHLLEQRLAKLLLARTRSALRESSSA